MRYLLYFEDLGGETTPFGDTGWWIKKFCGWYGVHPYPITPGARLEAVTAFPEFAGHSWVWLDAKADHGLVAVPTEDVVFCVGHDYHGFYGYEGEGLRCKLRSMHPDGVDEEYHAAICATLLLHEVYG
jgi:hypothetical protein